jgi:hypothetical protein
VRIAAIQINAGSDPALNFESPDPVALRAGGRGRRRPERYPRGEAGLLAGVRS